MLKRRSPNYPSISLRKAIELAQKLYSEAHTNKASSETVAKALGYAGLNGASMGVISALKKYGLLEAAGAEFRISKDGLSILVDPKSSPEWAGAIIRAAFRPALFMELRKEYGDTPPKSDDFLRAFLLKRGFVQGVVDTPIRTYRDTMVLVEQAREVLKGVDAPDQMPDELDEESDTVSQASETLAPVPPVYPTHHALLPAQLVDVLDDVYKLPDGRAFVLRWPASLSVEEYEDFEAWIGLLQRKLKRSIQQ